MKRSRIMPAVALGLGSLLLSLLAAELFLALLRPVDYMAPAPDLDSNAWRDLVHRRSEVPGLAYELAPTPRRAKGPTNAYGMRDLPPMPAGAPRVLRIAVLGDSFTFGLGVAMEEAYPNVLEHSLRSARDAGSRPVDVLNFGVGGYSIADEVRVLEHKALAWSPDIVVVGYVLNDPETRPIQPLQRHFSEPRWWQHSHLLRLAAQYRDERTRQRLGGGDYYRAIHAREGAHWSSVPAAFEAMRTLTRPEGIPVLVVIFPAETEDWERYPYRDLHAQVASAASAAGLEVLDLLDAFSAHEPARVQQGRRDPHPTAAGHRIAALEIQQRLLADHSDLLGEPGAGGLR